MTYNKINVSHPNTRFALIDNDDSTHFIVRCFQPFGDVIGTTAMAAERCAANTYRRRRRGCSVVQTNHCAQRFDFANGFAISERETSAHATQMYLSFSFLCQSTEER